MFGLENKELKPTINENWKGEGKEIKKLKELCGQTMRVWGYMTTKDAGFGRGILLCGETCKISLPKRYYESFTKGSDADKEMLMSGLIYITNIKEIETKNHTKTYVFDLEQR